MLNECVRKRGECCELAFLLENKKGQATPIAPLNQIPLLCSQPGGVIGSWS